MGRAINRVQCAAGALLLVACGGSTGSDGSDGSAAETTIDTWSDYCVATFTEAYEVEEFGDVLFTAQPGDEYVMVSFDAGASPELAYLAATGPLTFSVNADPSALPFTSNCEAGSTTDHIAVFSDVTVFADEELTTPLCELEAGSAHPRAPAAGAGYGATGSGVNSGIIYEVMLNSFSADCDGATLGYVNVPQTSAFGTFTWLVPIILIVGPG